MELFEKGGRPELVEQEGRELAMIQEYVPKQMSPEDVVKVNGEVVTETSAGSPSDFWQSDSFGDELPEGPGGR